MARLPLGFCRCHEGACPTAPVARTGSRGPVRVPAITWPGPSHSSRGADPDRAFGDRAGPRATRLRALGFGADASAGERSRVASSPLAPPRPAPSPIRVRPPDARPSGRLRPGRLPLAAAAGDACVAGGLRRPPRASMAGAACQCGVGPEEAEQTPPCRTRSLKCRAGWAHPACEADGRSSPTRTMWLGRGDCGRPAPGATPVRSGPAALAGHRAHSAGPW
jgi:hypothetical protein